MIENKILIGYHSKRYLLIYFKKTEITEVPKALNSTFFEEIRKF